MKSIFDRPRAARFISHRGFQPLAPANSLPGFAYAGQMGQWAIETDVRMTADGELVCCHDAEVDALFDGSGSIADMTWEALSALRMTTGNRLECFPEAILRMPRFVEYLNICRHAGSIPFIELKTDDVEAVITTLHEKGWDDREVIMSSSSLERLAETRRLAPEMFIHWIFAKEEQIGELAALGNAGLSWKIADAFSCPPEKIALAHDMGLKVCLRAADDEATVRHMVALGLDYLPSNCMHAPMTLDLSGGRVR